MEEKQGTETEHNGSNSMDMISELPLSILHHILSFLPEKSATQTCVLSKPWHHIWSTRPKIKLCESKFPWRSDLFLPALDNLFQRYHDQNLSIQELCLNFEFDSESVSILNKWMPIVKVFNLHFYSYAYGDTHYCDIPLSVLEAESLKKVCMEGCMLSDRNPSSVGKFKHLQTLHLISVEIKDEAFEKMVSFCPRLKSLTLEYIQLSNDSVNFFSSNHMPCLEYLELHRCEGFTEFHLLSRSIKHLIIQNYWNIPPVVRATIDVSSILCFKYSSSCIPSISFTTTNDHEWKSEIDFKFEKVDVDSSWFVKLNKLLSTLSRSEISLTLRGPWEEIEDPQDNDDTCLYRRPVMVENLFIPCFYRRDFIHNILFRVCHPRNISSRNISSDKFRFEWELELKIVEEVLYEILILERGATGHCLWQRDLEEVRVEAFDKSGKREHWPRLNDLNRLCFRLKWS